MADEPQPTPVTVENADLQADPTPVDPGDEAPADAPTAVPPADSDDAQQSSGANFVVEGELPLSTDEVNALIAFVERETGRDFLRPPVIVAQTDAAFLAGLEEDFEDFGEDSDVDVRTLQALGLTDQGVDQVTQAFKDLLLSPEGILGYYDSETDELYVPVDAGGDDAFRSLLVHELTHALDGQYEDLNVLDALVDEADITGDYEPVRTLQAVAEGRASAVQTRWMNDNGVTPEIPEDLGAAENVPPSLLLSLSIPYVFGEQYIETQGGPAETWDLLATPPPSSEVFMSPFSDAADEAIIDVAAPAADGPVLDEVVFGASDILSWLLGESLEPDTARLFPTISAIDGWAGGRSVLWGDDQQSCIRIALAADSDADLGEIRDAIELWAGDSADRNVAIEGDLVVATGCAAYVP